jgi:hypothetical protein
MFPRHRKPPDPSPPTVSKGLTSRSLWCFEDTPKVWTIPAELACFYASRHSLTQTWRRHPPVTRPPLSTVPTYVKIGRLDCLYGGQEDEASDLYDEPSVSALYTRTLLFRSGEVKTFLRFSHLLHPHHSRSLESPQEDPGLGPRVTSPAKVTTTTELYSPPGHCAPAHARHRTAHERR